MVKAVRLIRSASALLNTELDKHLDSDGAEGKSNHRNGYSNRPSRDLVRILCGPDRLETPFNESHSLMGSSPATASGADR